ncbi:DUF2865 domain-containing protein [Bosea sp. (in: a-proteobacteria)]|uniref:DUF2865 domain-containing protein n=1 Tax=Bosea sp. (in: a-proteobacteria) TaxID=1871050 RepID=UPI002FC73474
MFGTGAVLAASSLVLAEDDAGIRAFHRNEAARHSGRPASASAYAPLGGVFSRPPLAMRSDGRIAHPPAGLDSSARRKAGRPARSDPRDHGTIAGGGGRTICVRLCDGFHAPVGQLRSQGDLKAHEALCEAQNPGVPVRLFRLPPGATTIERAVAADGASYAALPAAYAYEKTSDPTCRPAIANPGERRVSLLRDITLRPGDSIVLDGKVATFAGSSGWPYRAEDFQDFRQAGKLGPGTKRLIDETVGVTQAETRQKLLRQSLQVREAPRELASVAELRGTLDAGQREPAAIRETILR